MSRRPWLSGLSAFVVLFASLAAAQIRPQGAGSPSGHGGWHGPTDHALGLAVAVGADRGDARLMQAVRPRLPGAGPAHAPPPFALTFTLPAALVFPAPLAGRERFGHSGARLVGSSRPAAHGARGPPARAFI